MKETNHLNTPQKVVVTLWLILPWLFAYWRGYSTWMFFDLSDQEIQFTFFKDLVFGYVLFGVFSFVLIRLWKSNK